MNLVHLSLQRPVSVTGRDRTGTQSLGRGIKLMRMIAARPEFSWRLSDLAIPRNQGKATVHHMLTCMVEGRLMEQRASDRHYHYLPGPLMLGLALPDRAPIPALRRGGGAGAAIIEIGATLPTWRADVNVGFRASSSNGCRSAVRSFEDIRGRLPISCVTEKLAIPNR